MPNFFIQWLSLVVKCHLPPSLTVVALDVLPVCLPACLAACSHIFCEECISEWLTRDKAATCPMCRAQIQPPGEAMASLPYVSW